MSRNSLNVKCGKQSLLKMSNTMSKLCNQIPMMVRYFQQLFSELANQWSGHHHKPVPSLLFKEGTDYVIQKQARLWGVAPTCQDLLIWNNGKEVLAFNTFACFSVTRNNLNANDFKPLALKIKLLVEPKSDIEHTHKI